MDQHAALIVIDVQNDFCPGGALAVPNGHTVITIINQIAQLFETIVVTQDWHPEQHLSFATQHPGKAPFETVNLHYGEQTLWPIHCVMDSEGAALHPELAIPHTSLILRKGSHQHVDSYSAFLEADRTTRTGLDGYLTARGITHVYLCGLATDFCVAWSAQDAVSYGFTTTIIEDACRAIDLNGSLETAWRQLEKAGVHRIMSATLA